MSYGVKGSTPHGSYHRYDRYGCRCPLCKRANADHIAAWRARKVRTVCACGAFLAEDDAGRIFCPDCSPELVLP